MNCGEGVATDGRIALGQYDNRRSNIMSTATVEFGAAMLLQDEELDAVSGGILPAIAIGVGLGALFGVGMVAGTELADHQHQGSVIRGIVRGLPKS
jgi:lactobin A/cerein 7B family class IIb bacteriocin